jgi:hypothetical protein
VVTASQLTAFFCEEVRESTRVYEQAIVQEGMQAGILNWHSSVVVACMDIAAKHKVPPFFGFGATEVVNEKYASDPVVGKEYGNDSQLDRVPLAHGRRTDP